VPVSYSIPPNFADAFHEAMLRYSYWEHGKPEPSLTLQGRSRPISDACKIALEFDDRIPQYFQRMLLSLIEIPDDPHAANDLSYAKGARSLLTEIEARKGRYEQQGESK
jgi:hypothetical protein